VLQQHHFDSGITSTAMLPLAADAQQRHMLLGFEDGWVRLVARCSYGWAVLAATRPFKVWEGCFEGLQMALVVACS
jgi:hypothetical protein